MRLTVDGALLDALAPFHLLVDPAGRIVNVGRSFERIAPGALGRTLSDVIELRQPEAIGTVADLRARPGQRLELRLKAERNVPPHGTRTRLRGVAYPMDTCVLLVPYFGADIAQAVARHGLTAGDLAQFDLTVEVLFLLEARSAVLAAHGSQDDHLRRARREAEREAVTDGLTGLGNRRALDRRLTELSDPEGPPFGLIQIDLDYFKAINDRLGHAAGDFVLAEVGRILLRQVRDGDMVARIGGDEFMILLEGCTDLALMQGIAVRIISELERPILYRGRECRISGSIGITLSEFYARLDADQLIGDLDTALYASKREGRARYHIARPTAVEPPAAH